MPEKADMYRVGSAPVTVATIPLAFGLAGDTHVVLSKTTASQTIAIAAAVSALFYWSGFGTSTHWWQQPSKLTKI
jgi:hypothetical protein